MLSNSSPSIEAKAPALPSSGSENAKTPPASFFAMIFLLLVDSMQIKQETVMTQAKEINSNANIQNQLNAQNAQIHFEILPPNATPGQISQVQEANQEFSAERENIQSCLITARQGGQVLMTQTSTNVNLLQQDSSEDSGWLQTLNTIFSVIDQMSPGSRS